MVFIGWVIASCLMLLMFGIQKKIGDAGVVDIAWSLGVALVVGFFVLNITDIAERSMLIMVLVLLWACRLSWHVFLRFYRSPPDGRYEELKKKWGEHANWRMFKFYQMQGLGIVLFSIPPLISLLNPHPITWLDWLGVTIGVVAILGETLADFQLARFRGRPENKGQVCQSGLWRYSRHPNYFFEWLFWWSFVGLSLTWLPWGLITLTGPLAMWYFLTQITGIPHTEAQSIRSRGAAYRHYQQTTNAFFPWFPKNTNG